MIMDISELTESYFRLTPYEKRAFHLVTNLTKKKEDKYFGPNGYFNENNVRERLIRNHNERVRKRKLRRKLKGALD